MSAPLVDLGRLGLAGSLRIEEEERAYRADWLGSAGRSLSVAAAAVAVLFLAFIPNDIALAPSTGAWLVAAVLRLVAAVALASAAVVLRRCPSWAASAAGERWFSAVAVVAGLCFLGVVAVRPDGLTNLVVSAVLFGVATLLFGPMPLLHRVGVVAAFDVGFITVVGLVATDASPHAWTVAVLLALTLVCSALCARHLELKGRIAFLAVQQAARTSEDLREALETSDRLRRQLASQLASDELTGLASRRAFFDIAASESTLLERAGSLLAIDVDHFKQINDTFGHAAGDLVLRSVAGGIQVSVRPEDLAARLGGEEFAVWLPGADHAVAATVAERIRVVVERTQLPLPGARVTVSIGIAERCEGESFDSLLRRSDLAMYGAKHAGRNRIGAALAESA